MTMGRKKGKQCGTHSSKRSNAYHHHTIYNDYASEADSYRNPVSRNGWKGGGYRASSGGTLYGGGIGDWGDGVGVGGCVGHGGGDKWSSIFSHRNASGSNEASTTTTAATTATSTTGLAHLRHLLQERRIEDRMFDRSERLRLQQSRIRSTASTALADNSSIEGATKKETSNEERHETGWLLSYASHESDNNSVLPSLKLANDPFSLDWSNGRTCTTDDFGNEIYSRQQRKQQEKEQFNIQQQQELVPTLQGLAVHVLGPYLPTYCELCGHDYVGECLKSVSPTILAELSISLANANGKNANKQSLNFSSGVATTNEAVKALVHSGMASGLVFRGAGNRNNPQDKDHTNHTLGHAARGRRNMLSNQNFAREQNNASYSSSLSTLHPSRGSYFDDRGFLALCPRLINSPSHIGKKDERQQQIDGHRKCGFGSDINRHDLDDNCVCNHYKLDQHGGIGTDESELDRDERDESDECGDWETLDVDLDLTSRMAGCFHLKRLELVDVPLLVGESGEVGTSHGVGTVGMAGMARSARSSGGISLVALRAVFRSCTSITHLSLSGCFDNASNFGAYSAKDPEEYVTLLLCGGSLTEGNFGADGNTILSVEQALEEFHELKFLGEHVQHGHQSNKAGRNKFAGSRSRNSLISGLNELLPELEVLDISNCDWVTPRALFQFVLNCWENAYISRYGKRIFETARGGSHSKGIHTADVVTAADGESAEDDDGFRSDQDVDFCPTTSKRETAAIRPKLCYLNVRGCKGLLPSAVDSSTSRPTSTSTSFQNRAADLHQVVQEWNRLDLFDGIDLSTRHHSR